MKSKIFQQILDETPEDIKVSMREYANLMIERNQLSHQKKTITKIIHKPLFNLKEFCNKILHSFFNLFLPFKKKDKQKC